VKRANINRVACVLIILGVILGGLFLQEADACTRAVYLGPEGMIITGRTMDWMEDTMTNLWAFPRGMKRSGEAGAGSVEWVSKYGSVAASGYEAGVADGMNEKGLAANLLYLAEADYGTRDSARPAISISTWTQYVLDNFATVSEAVKSLGEEPFQIIAPRMPNGAPAALHLAISDPSGDSAILEYVAGKLVIHHGRQFQVMTNSPLYDQQLALNAYWKAIGGLIMLPGTNRAADRFVRASFYIDVIPRTADSRRAVASVFSVMRNVSVPLGISTPGQPNISSTIWRTVADHKNMVYYFESTMSPTVFWVPLAELDLKEGSPVRKLTLTGGKMYFGNAAAGFEPATPFRFFPAAAK
jgi:penicillin V acylase-like amidase (Ntn superfamily)